MLSIRENVIPELRGKGNLLNVYVVPHGNPENSFDRISAPDAEFVMKPVSPLLLGEHFDGAILGKIYDDELTWESVGELSFWKSPLDAIREVEEDRGPIQRIEYDSNEPLIWDIDGTSFLFLKHADDFRDLMNDTLSRRLRNKINKVKNSDIRRVVDHYFS